MSYHGGAPPGNNGYWTGQEPPTNTYGIQPSRSPFMPNGTPQQYQPPANEGQYYNQNGQAQYGMSTNYANNGFYSQPPQQQVEQPQFISPAQLFQQPPTPSTLSHPSQYTSHRSMPTNSASYNTNSMAPLVSPVAQPDTAQLLVALAEEYFQAAHELAPTAAVSMSVADVEAYGGLIATGLGCLDTALKRVKLQPRMEANIRLRYAGVLYEETENSMEAETALSKGIALCERVRSMLPSLDQANAAARIIITTSNTPCSSYSRNSWQRRIRRLL